MGQGEDRKGKKAVRSRTESVETSACCDLKQPWLLISIACPGFPGLVLGQSWAGAEKSFARLCSRARLSGHPGTGSNVGLVHSPSKAFLCFRGCTGQGQLHSSACGASCASDLPCPL